MLSSLLSGHVVVAKSECLRALVAPTATHGFEMWAAYIYRRTPAGDWTLTAKSGHWSQTYATRWAVKAAAAVGALEGASC